MAVKKSGVLLFYIETRKEITFLTDTSEITSYDPVLAGGFLSALSHFSNWMGEPLEALILEKRVLWLKEYVDFTLVLSINRHPPNYPNWTVEHYAIQLADSLCGSIKQLLNSLSDDFLRQEPGIGELLGEIIRHESEELSLKCLNQTVHEKILEKQIV